MARVARRQWADGPRGEDPCRNSCSSAASLPPKPGTAAIAAAGAGDDPAASFLAARGTALARYDALVAELRAGGAADLAALTVAGRELRALIAGAGG